jgi:hypothetical protein
MRAVPLIFPSTVRASSGVKTTGNFGGRFARSMLSIQGSSCDGANGGPLCVHF